MEIADFAETPERRAVARWVMAALAVGLVAFTVGCQLTRQNYTAISLGMAPDEVKKILGSPRYQFDDEWVYTRDDPRDLVKVSVYFGEHDKVVGKCWQNPERPWENHREGQVP